jgi:hypothetical protein
VPKPKRSEDWRDTPLYTDRAIVSMAEELHLHLRREAILAEAARRRERGVEAYRKATKAGEHIDCDDDDGPEAA